MILSRLAWRSRRKILLSIRVAPLENRTLKSPGEPTNGCLDTRILFTKIYLFFQKRLPGQVSSRKKRQ
jgi:hypothetical protein